MKKQITFYLFLLGSLLSFAQNNEESLSDYLRNFQYQKALKYIDRQEPTKELLVQKALCYKYLDDCAKAVGVLIPLSEKFPQDIQIKSELAICYAAIGQRQSSIDCYNDLIGMDSLNAYFKIQKAGMFYIDGKYTNALEIYKKLLDGYQTSNILKQTALCYEKMNEPDSAKTYFGKVIDINPSDAFSVASLTNICLKGGGIGIAEGIHHSEAYMKLDSTDRQVNLLNALCYYSMDDYEKSITLFKKCYMRGDTSLIVNRSLGISYYSMNDSYEAHVYLERAYRQDSTNNNVLYCYAMTCLDMADHKLAIPLFHKLLNRTIPPDLTLYLYYKNLGLAYDKGSDFQNAVGNYIKTLKHAGNDQTMGMHYSIASMYEFKLKNAKEAINYYNLYRGSLVEYLDSLQKKEKPNEKQIKDVELRIKYLDEHVAKIKKDGVGNESLIRIRPKQQ